MPILPLTSDLKRKAWMTEGLAQTASKSFWSPMTGGSRKSVVYQVNDNNAKKDGHTIIFDYGGNLVGKAVKGKDTAYGTGETKKKFSDSITVARYRLVADNGDIFDGVDIGDLNITQHSDSREKLGDLFVRFKDQAIFDAAQGHVNGLAGTHDIDLGTAFTFNSLTTIERIVKTSIGYTTGSTRRPLEPYTLKNGQKCWLLVIDTAMATLLKQNSAFQTVIQSADLRGDKNRLIKGVLGKIGQIVILEADTFFGETTVFTGSGDTIDWGLNASSIEIAGLRQYDTAGKWTGTTGFNAADTLHSRGLLLGAGAIQIAFGKQPDYKFQESQDFAISSESAVEFWMNCNKTKLVAENGDYEQAKIAGLDHGVVTVTVQV